MTLAPIVLFVYNRPWHTRQTIESLQKNELASESELFIFSDGSKNDNDIDKVKQVRDYIKTIDGFKKINIIEREKNLGLANNIIDGVTRIVNKYGTIIVLEDDLVSSPYFLRYMNEALTLFAEDERVISIHGYVYPLNEELPEAFFLPGADCWGWATWQRGWAEFNPDGGALLKELKLRKLIRAFDFNGTYPYSKMLQSQIEGKNDSWAILWYASAFLANKLTLYPGRSLIKNIGNDSSGRHCGANNTLDVQLSASPIDLKHIKQVVPSKEGLAAFERFLRMQHKSVLSRVWHRFMPF